VSEIRNIIGEEQVKKACGGMSKSTRWRGERKGIFPKRVQLSDNRVGWFEDEIIEWQKNLQRGPAVFTENLKKGKYSKETHG
jgi:predicted DNA-binding transcriptional regulator AlpA